MSGWAMADSAVAKRIGRLANGLAGVAVSPVDPANQTEALNKVAAQTLLGK